MEVDSHTLEAVVRIPEGAVAFPADRLVEAVRIHTLEAVVRIPEEELQLPEEEADVHQMEAAAEVVDHLEVEFLR